jgi:Cu(I)/Ag(I) efflux system protein CusF
MAVAALSPLAAKAQDMADMPGMSHAAAPSEGQGVGIVKAIDPARGTITLQHEAIASIQWPAMTMAFKTASPDLLKKVKVGDKVQFTVKPNGIDSTVTAIKTRQP